MGRFIKSRPCPRCGNFSLTYDNIGAIAVIIAVELGLVMRWRQSENAGD